MMIVEKRNNGVGVVLMILESTWGQEVIAFLVSAVMAGIGMNAEIVIVVPEGRSLLDQLPMVCGLTTNSLNWREMRIKMASLEDHTAVVAMHKRESSVSEISKTLKLHREQVDPDINRFGEAGRIENRPRGRSDRTARTPAL
ncbi:hypothetical protein Y032_0045g1259 [Ancylostoma ceylanicum]|uniref:Uncharacterized protein n=1 Tax=Ancylostoma ceylanicum TaxID=53326 RepID=A0A016UD80_9BILA|nr:hypothetical protein Y032_0045g1259 [Ancylostoma ceylanicum]